MPAPVEISPKFQAGRNLFDGFYRIGKSFRGEWEGRRVGSLRGAFFVTCAPVGY